MKKLSGFLISFGAERYGMESWIKTKDRISFQPDIRCHSKVAELSPIEPAPFFLEILFDLIRSKVDPESENLFKKERAIAEEALRY